MQDPVFNRRQLIQCSTAAGLAALALPAASGAEKTVVRGNIKQSIVYWCFNATGDKWDIEKTCEVALQLGCPSIELVTPEDWPVLKKHKLICAIAPNGMPGAPFKKGLNNPAFHAEVIDCTKKTIDACAEAGFPNVIAFNGYKYLSPDDPRSGEIPKEEGAANCVKALKQLAGYAEKKKVTICVEHLNSRDDSHPMKGHPGYQGDDLDYVAAILRKVGSPYVKLLFDIYHVQVMHGDVIRRLEQTKDVIGHVHTAGCPGRGELDNTQELNYAPIMRKLLEIKYSGYVGQEFMPTRNALESLREAVKTCDV